MSSSVPYDPQDPLTDNPFAEHGSAVSDPSFARPPENIGEESDEGEEQGEEPEVPTQTVDTTSDIARSDSGSTGHLSHSSQASLNSVPKAPGQHESQVHQQAQPPKQQIDITTILPERKDTGKFKLVVKVTDLERIGSSSNKKDNPTVVLDFSSNIPTFRKKNHKKVKKCHQEFINLTKFLRANIPESFIPSLPATYTNYGINNEEDRVSTIHAYQEWFNRIAADPLILRNEELAFFLESDYNTYVPINRVKPQVTGLKRKTLKQLSPPYDEVTELAEFRPLVKALYVRAQNVQEKLLKASRSRRMLVQEENDFGQMFGLMDSNENEHRLYKRYGKVMTAVGDINSIIATMDMATFYDGLEWIVKDAYVVKETLTDRHFIMRDLIQAQQNTKAKQEQARKLRSKRDTNPIKIDDAQRSMKLANQNEQELTVQLQRVTANMLIERNQWVSWYETWLIRSIKDYTLRRIEYERKKLTLLERVRTEVRRADTNGGLSRLGRHTVSNKDDDISQSVNGDSWTGDKRRHSQKQIDRVSHTEFDKSLNAEDQDGSSTEISASGKTADGKLSNGSNNTLDARSAAHMLGITNFNGR